MIFLGDQVRDGLLQSWPVQAVAAVQSTGSASVTSGCRSSRADETPSALAQDSSEEILASLLGAMICNADADRITLFAKAAAELLDRGQSAESANRQLHGLTRG